jgi:hypothetical protein
MNTLLTALLTHNTEAPKAKGRKAKSAPTNLHDLVLIDYSNAKACNTASGAEWVGFKSLLLACEGTLKDTTLYGLLVQDIKEVFKDLPEVARARVQYLNNARRVAYGGVVGSEQRGSKQVVSGKGWQAVEAVLEKADSFRSFKTSIASEVPEAMKKAKSIPNSHKGEKDMPEANDTGLESHTVEFADSKSAFQAAIDLLKLVDKHLKPSSDHELIMSLHATVKGLERKIA